MKAKTCRPPHDLSSSSPSQVRFGTAGLRHPCAARGFSLLELLVVMLVMVCLVAWYIRITEEADSLSRILRGHDEERAVEPRTVRDRPARLIDLRRASAAQRTEARSALGDEFREAELAESGDAAEAREGVNAIAVY